MISRFRSKVLIQPPSEDDLVQLMCDKLQRMGFLQVMENKQLAIDMYRKMKTQDHRSVDNVIETLRTRLLVACTSEPSLAIELATFGHPRCVFQPIIEDVLQEQREFQQHYKVNGPDELAVEAELVMSFELDVTGPSIRGGALIYSSDYSQATSFKVHDRKIELDDKVATDFEIKTLSKTFSPFTPMCVPHNLFSAIMADWLKSPEHTASTIILTIRSLLQEHTPDSQKQKQKIDMDSMDGWRQAAHYIEMHRFETPFYNATATEVALKHAEIIQLDDDEARPHKRLCTERRAPATRQQVVDTNTTDRRSSAPRHPVIDLSVAEHSQTVIDLSVTKHIQPVIDLSVTEHSQPVIDLLSIAARRESSSSQQMIDAIAVQPSLPTYFNLPAGGCPTIAIGKMNSFQKALYGLYHCIGQTVAEARKLLEFDNPKDWNNAKILDKMQEWTTRPMKAEKHSGYRIWFADCTSRSCVALNWQTGAAGCQCRHQAT